ncbi:MAG: class I SAM-dependent methyltransferase [Deltaproteobacteria bacterium]|nr:class I SAM-dependent methyltransferase [Deltaproteobacteria bacterium]
MNRSKTHPRQKILDQVRGYYSAKIRAHGPTAQGVDWNGPESQRLRFGQLANVFRGSEGHFSLNDLGCGYGALADYLAGRGFEFSYRGLDICPEMIEQARRLHGQEPNRDRGWSFAVGSRLETADYTLASGIFNVRGQVRGNDWQAYVQETIEEMNRHSLKGLAFNMLTSYSDPERMEARLYYADPLAVFDYCRRNLSRHVALLHDYGLYEFTLIVRKDLNPKP